MEFKGTQGEWESNGLHITIKDKPYKRIGQSLLMNFNHDKRGRMIPDTEGYANAQLIATAPELLEALQHGLRLADALDNKESIAVRMFVKNATKAISKALSINDV
jgi:hypothetical protein